MMNKEKQTFQSLLENSRSINLDEPTIDNLEKKSNIAQNSSLKLVQKRNNDILSAGDIYEDDLYEYHYEESYSIVQFKGDPPVDPYTGHILLNENLYTETKFEWIRNIYDGWGVKLKKDTDISNIEFHEPIREIEGKKIISYESLFANLMLEKIIIKNWNFENITHTRCMFYGSNIKLVNVENVNLNNCIQCGSMFREFSGNTLLLKNFQFGTAQLDSFFVMSNINEVIFDNFDVSKVKSFISFFMRCTINKINIEALDTSSAENMISIFSESKINNLNLSTLKTTNVEDMSCMFMNCTYDSLDLSNLDITNVREMQGMFNGSNINTIIMPKTIPNKLYNVTTMFKGFKGNCIDLSNFQTNSITTFKGMFYESNIQTLNISNFNYEKATDLNLMFNNATIKELKIESLNIEKYPNLSNVNQTIVKTAEENYDIFTLMLIGGIKKETTNIFENSKIDKCYISSLKTIEQLSMNRYRNSINELLLVINNRIERIES